MNLFIFRVETGTMLEFQLDMATKSVGALKLEIQNVLQVPPEDQVLLMSGGICLENAAKVISYSSGTDTNPIFLFSKQSIEASTPPVASACRQAYAAPAQAPRATDAADVLAARDDDAGDRDDDDGDDGDAIHRAGYSSYGEFRARVLQSKRLRPTMETVTRRARLAQEFHEEALRERQCCQSIVYDQQLQNQGWLAAIANLEDIVSDFQKRVASVRQFFDEYLEQRAGHVEFLGVYKDALDALARIPIIPALLLADAQPAATLLEWIEARRDSNSDTTMESLYESCARGLEYYHADLFALLYDEVRCAVDTASKGEMKDIQGLSERLFGLDQLAQSCERLVSEQDYSAKSFQSNQARAGDLRDPSVLPDLCDSHRNQLVGMLHNHWRLCDIHKRCMRSKEELCHNLYRRLKWVIHAENLLRASTDRLLAYYENVLRLRCNLGVLRQIHAVPEVYVAAVVEVLRRKQFSRAFLRWASELACHMLTIHSEEVARRKEFRARHEGHFLMGLFPGMADLPPSFATQAPSVFDAALPSVAPEDVDALRRAVPELAERLAVPDMAAIASFFLTKSQSQARSGEDKAEGTCEEKLVQVVAEVGLASTLDRSLLRVPGEGAGEAEAGAEACPLPHGVAQLKDLDRGCESETDTEEFEKVCQSPTDPQYGDGATAAAAGAEAEVGCDRSGAPQQPAPPRKPPRTFRALSASGGSHTESFANIKNTSLESIDELSSLRNVGDSCYSWHHHQHAHAVAHGVGGGGGGGGNSGGGGLGAACTFVRSKSLSPHGAGGEPIASPGSPSPSQGHQPSDFVNEEYYIDESLPSSLSIDAACGQAQAVGEIAQQLSNANDVVALLQDNLQSSRGEQDKLKDLLVGMAAVYRTIVADLRHEMAEIRTTVQCESTALERRCRSLSSSWDNLALELDLKERQRCQLGESRQHELAACRQQLKAHSDEIKCLREENSCLDASLNKLAAENRQLLSAQGSAGAPYEARIAELQAALAERSERERALHERSERMAREHRAEMDCLRKRFRLMTGRTAPDAEGASPTEAADAERAKIVDESARADKERALELQRVRDETKRTVREKDALIAALHLDCAKQKALLRQLTEAQMEKSAAAADQRRQLEALQRERDDLEQQLGAELLRRMEMSEMSVSASSCSGGPARHSTAAAAAARHREPLTASQAALVNANRISVSSCARGDRVLVMWKAAYKNFVVLQRSDVLHFVHADCTRGYQQAAGADRARVYFTALVDEKEYCQTKKSENRYNVPKGTRFYRVKVTPVGSAEEPQTRPPPQMSQSHTVARSAPPAPMDDSACHSLPSTPTREEK